MQKSNNLALRVPTATLSQSLCKSRTFYSMHLTVKPTVNKGWDVYDKENSDRTRCYIGWFSLRFSTQLPCIIIFRLFRASFILSLLLT